jgi:hypothetical protein
MVLRQAVLGVVALLAIAPARAAVETRLGEGNMVAKPTTLLPGLHRSNNGTAIFVFALPDN